jgi:hypothetical protein
MGCARRTVGKTTQQTGRDKGHHTAPSTGWHQMPRARAHRSHRQPMNSPAEAVPPVAPSGNRVPARDASRGRTVVAALNLLREHNPILSLDVCVTGLQRPFVSPRPSPPGRRQASFAVFRDRPCPPPDRSAIAHQSEASRSRPNPMPWIPLASATGRRTRTAPDPSRRSLDRDPLLHHPS